MYCAVLHYVANLLFNDYFKNFCCLSIFRFGVVWSISWSVGRSVSSTVIKTDEEVTSALYLIYPALGRVFHHSRVQVDCFALYPRTFASVKSDSRIRTNTNFLCFTP